MCNTFAIYFQIFVTFGYKKVKNSDEHLLLYTQDTVISFNKINGFLCVYQDVTMILGSQVYSSRHFPPSYPASAGLCVGLLLILEVVLK